MSTKFTNNASSKLTQALTADATSMHIQAEDVSKFPVLGAEDFCRLTIVGDHGDHEIVKVTSISSDGTCTIERAQESTTAKEWPIENRVELRITAEYLNSITTSEDVLSLISPIEEDISTIEDNITNIENDISSISSAQEEIINTTIPSLPDDATISFEGNKLQVEDIAIGGDVNDLASARGLLGTLAVLPDDIDLNTVQTQGFYRVRGKTAINSPTLNFSTLLVFAYSSSTIIQVVFVVNSTPYYRALYDGVWTAWTSLISSATIGDGITVNNGIISVPEYEGATSSTTATSGLVPPATSAERNNFLRGDGTWQQVDLSDYALKTDLTKYLPLTGTAAKATILTTARTIHTNLASTSAASFNGSADITPGVTGILPVANGGTGSSTEKYIPLTSKSSSVTSTSETTVATSKAVKTAYDKAIEAADKAGLPLGYIYSWPFGTPPDGSIIANGSTYNRTLYNDLWTYVSSKSDWVKTEAEWQSIASANGGYCPYYSNGNGTTTFRTPKFAPYQQLAISAANAGTYHRAGLPELGGTVGVVGGADNHPVYSIRTGVFKNSEPTTSTFGATGVGAGPKLLKFAASLYNSHYGRSDTVQPESNEWIVCVVAYGSATNVGNVDVANVMSAVNMVQANPNLQGVVHVVETWNETGGSGWYRIWSNGWCEQGQYVLTSYANVTFYKEFIDTNYALIGVGFGIDSTGSKKEEKKTNGFSTSNSVRTSYTNGWRAEGFIR